MEGTKIAKRFEGKVAIVTASTQGIGFAIAERFGLEGASVVISSRKQKNVDEAVEKLKSRGIEVLGVVCHVSNAQQRKNLIDKTIQVRGKAHLLHIVFAMEVRQANRWSQFILAIPFGLPSLDNGIYVVLKKYGKVDVVVSNAAANPSVDSILQTQESVLDKLWDINVKSSILILKDAGPHMSKGSSVVIISSIAGYHPLASMAMYGVTKTALLGLTKALAAEMAPNTRVNCVAPGFVPTHFASFITENDAVRKELKGRTMLNRLGTTQDMAAATAFLASDDASYVTGETLVVAGGAPSRL